jgi:hypothetical protein
MKIWYRLALCIPALVLVASLCACREAQDAKTQTPVPATSTSQVTSLVDRFAESGLELKDSVSGDLNKDSLPDLILLFSSRKSESKPAADTVAPRPLVILVGTGEGGFQQVAVNWNAVLCETCGNRLSDPYAKIVIKDGFFSLEHAASDTAMGWKRVTTFKYADSLKTWFLNRDGMISWNAAGEGEKPFEYHVIKTRKDFGQIPIDSFDIYALENHFPDIRDYNGFPVPFNHTSSYMDHHRVKSGIWHILDYCADKLSQGYLFFAKASGKAYESEFEEEFEVSYRLVHNVVADDTCQGYAVKNAPSVRPGKVSRAQYDSSAKLYHLGTDTIRFYNENLPSDPNWHIFVFKRDQDTLILSTGFAQEGFSSIDYAGDINADGYLDFIESYNNNYASNTLYLSNKDSVGHVRMKAVAGSSFTE